MPKPRADGRSKKNKRKKGKIKEKKNKKSVSDRGNQASNGAGGVVALAGGAGSKARAIVREAVRARAGKGVPNPGELAARAAAADAGVEAIDSNWEQLRRRIGAKRKRVTSAVVRTAVAGHGRARSGSVLSVLSIEHTHVGLEGGAYGEPFEPPGGEYAVPPDARGEVDASGTSHITEHLAMDCEMVGVGTDESALAQVCIVNWSGQIVYLKYVKPVEKITDYRTHVSGIKALHMRHAHPFRTVQHEVGALIKDKILVGHALENDLKALMFQHPQRMTRDTGRYRPFMKQRRKGGRAYPRKLRDLTEVLLKRPIQSGQHSPAEDARAALALYRAHRKEWERAIRGKGKKLSELPIGAAFEAAVERSTQVLRRKSLADADKAEAASLKVTSTKDARSREPSEIAKRRKRQREVEATGGAGGADSSDDEDAKPRAAARARLLGAKMWQRDAARETMAEFG